MSREDRSLRVPRAVPPHLESRLAALRRLARVLDGAFRIPGTQRRFGWDPILGLIPWLGDAVTLWFGAAVVITAAQLRVPRIVLARIAFTALLDFLVGLLPVAGDLVDFAYRANARNMALLDLHAYEARPSTWGDRLFVLLVVGAMVSAVAVPVVLALWIGRALGLGVGWV